MSFLPLTTCCSFAALDSNSYTIINQMNVSQSSYANQYIIKLYSNEILKLSMSEKNL